MYDFNRWREADRAVQANLRRKLNLPDGDGSTLAQLVSLGERRLGRDDPDVARGRNSETAFGQITRSNS